MTHAQEVKGLGLNLVEGENLTFQRLVITTEAAVDTVVHTGVAGVYRRKEHKPTAINLVLAVLCGVENLLYICFVFDAKEFCHIIQVEPFEFAGFVEDVVQLRLRRSVVVKHAVQFVAVYEVLMSHIDLRINNYS